MELAPDTHKATFAKICVHLWKSNYKQSTWTRIDECMAVVLVFEETHKKGF